MRGRRVFGSPNGFVITRLHARYGKEDVQDDLVFQVAPPIVGGRERMGVASSPGTAAPKLEEGAVASSYNNFQARYAMRHAWTGEITCEHPVRGIWGGPPGGGSAPLSKAATNLAFAARGNVSLTAMVPAGIPELGIAGRGKSVYNDEPAPPVPSDPLWLNKPSAKAALPTTPSSAPASTNSNAKGSGCSVVSTHSMPLWWSLVLVALLWRRKRSWQLGA